MLDASGFAKGDQLPVSAIERQFCAHCGSQHGVLAGNHLEPANRRDTSDRAWNDPDEHTVGGAARMNPKAMIWISVALSAVAQIFLKRGLTNFQTRGGKPGMLCLATSIVSQPFIWLWGICFVAAMGLWLGGLQKLDLSYAYPLVSIGYVLVTLLSAVVVKERVDRHRWLAVGVISLGVVLIAGS